MSNDAFNDRLLEDEQVLWSGRPGKGLMLAKADVFITLVLLSMGLSFACDGIGAVGRVYGLFLIASPLFFYFYAYPFQNSLYAVTSSRILLLAGRTHNSFVALPLDHEFVFSLTKGRKGRGTILFGPNVRKHSDKPLFFPKSSFRRSFHYYPGLSMADCAYGGPHPHLLSFDGEGSVEQEHPRARAIALGMLLT